MTVESPFPWTLKTTGQTIIDELCYCGHKRSEHKNTFAYGHGGIYDDTVIICHKFTFRDWIMEDEEE